MLRWPSRRTYGRLVGDEKKEATEAITEVLFGFGPEKQTNGASGRPAEFGFLAWVR